MDLAAGAPCFVFLRTSTSCTYEGIPTYNITENSNLNSFLGFEMGLFRIPFSKMKWVVLFPTYVKFKLLAILNLNPFSDLK